MGANKQQLLKAFTEAEAYDGPSLIIAYSPCISHGINMSNCMEEEILAVDCGYWQLYRYNPLSKAENKPALVLDSGEPTADFSSFLMRENRFAALKNANPALAEELFAKAEAEASARRKLYRHLAEIL